MITSNNRGAINVLLISLVFMTLFFIGALGFGYWAYGNMQHYKTDSDKISAQAADKAVAAEDTKKDAEFAEASKSPFKVYQGPDAFGNLQISFPRSWSAFIDDTGSSGGAAVDGYFYPNVVPSVTSNKSTFALRVQVLNQNYNTILQTYNSFVSAKKGTLNPYSLPKLPNIVGIRMDGTVVPNKQGSMIVLPLRDKTIRIWTEAPAFQEDLDKNILPNLSFSP